MGELCSSSVSGIPVGILFATVGTECWIRQTFGLIQQASFYVLMLLQWLLFQDIKPDPTSLEIYVMSMLSESNIVL